MKNEGRKGLFLLFVILVVLKLANVVTWSWWIITLPIWIVPASIAIIVFGILFSIAIILGIAGCAALAMTLLEKV